MAAKSQDTALSNFLLDLSAKARETKENKQMGLYQTKQFLHSKGNHQQNKKTIQRMGEHMSQYKG